MHVQFKTRSVPVCRPLIKSRPSELLPRVGGGATSSLLVDCDFVAKQLFFIVGDGSTEWLDLLVVDHKAQAVLCYLFLGTVDGDYLRRPIKVR